MGLFGAAIWFFGKEGATTTVSGPHTAVVEIKGEIASGADASAEFVNAAMRSALEDSGSKALVLLINSPGGSPVQAGMINDEILRLKALHQKPVYAVVEETCASAAYYIAAAADEILRGQGQPGWQHWRVAGWLWLYRHHGKAGRGAPLAHRRGQQRHARPVQPHVARAARACAGNAGHHPPAVHHRGAARAGQAPA